MKRGDTVQVKATGELVTVHRVQVKRLAGHKQTLGAICIRPGGRLRTYGACELVDVEPGVVADA